MFVHNLTRVTKGWKSPAECADDIPQDVSLVLPFKDSLLDNYECEILQYNTKLITKENLKKVNDLFILELNEIINFQIVPAKKRLPYVGKYQHVDFNNTFVEIEPTDPKQLDNILLKYNIIIIGCYPFKHYRLEGKTLQ